MSDDAGLALLILLVGGGAAFAGYQGEFYVTGRQWYEGCYEAKVEQGRAGFAKISAPDPYKDAVWQNCEPSSLRAFFNAGLLFDGSDSRLAKKSCPSSWSDVPLGGFYFLALSTLQQQGGPSWWDSFVPADWMLSTSFKQRWPQCASARQQAGLPKMIETSPGNFTWPSGFKPAPTQSP